MASKCNTRQERRQESKTLQQALRWANLGRPVFPIWSRDGDECGCGNPKCKDQGKHPLGKLVPNGFKDATTDEAVIRGWFRRYPDAGIGVATGSSSGVIVIDLDVTDKPGGKDGFTKAVELGLPMTRMALTPSGGYHLYYQTQEKIPSNQKKLGTNIDVRAEGACATLPPSHGLYHWCNPKEPIEDLPEEWVTKLQSLKQDRRYGKSGPATSDKPIERITFDQIQERAVEWLWPDAVAIGEFNTWCGEPDKGKAQPATLSLLTSPPTPRHGPMAKRSRYKVRRCWY